MADAKQEMNNGTSQSRSVLAKPRLGAFGSSGFGASTFGSILRPSQLKPGNNPFLKVTDTEEAEKKEKADNETEKPKGEERLTETKEDAPKFVPLGATSSASRTSTQVPAPTQPASGTSGFVFGQNLSERVVIQDSVNNGDAGPSEHSMKNGTSELLFTSAAASVKENSQESAGSSSAGSAGLAAAAAEYERAQARPPPPAVTTTTGEEDEINVLQLSCRLFAWEAGSWRERGRGVLRLNDAAAGADASRLVARVAGSLRVVLNTKIWPDMVAERAGSKSLRITATDAQHQVKLFLVMGNPGDIVQLHRAVLARISLSKRAGDAASRLRDARETGEGDDCPAHAHRLHAPPLADDEQDAHTEDKDGDSESKDGEDKDGDAEDKDSNPLKRKEPVGDETSPKRQCPEILIE
ncbi:ran-binding protein 3 [Cydia fagiglandana]|uniref:ran-binding protein 3 n=1 Tax=Cydia fagiglandana TaxID=1458189 RepID=UPI002FEDEB0A